MNYLISVWGDRIQAEAVYSALEAAALPLSTITILGRGYASADEFGLIDPMQQARGQARLMSFWLVPFGFFSGIGFSVVSGLQTFAWAGGVGNHLIGGLLGAIGGAMGSFFVGGGVGLATGSSDALPYRNRLAEGKYLVIVRGDESLINQATRIMRPLRPENLQGYRAPEK
ncbi:MAG: hypothetical protein HC919_08700 [Oscillatoriales cyanobacterium SM2_2_1]|nr:hypothetical protein [Oscillatoriales cyanobacterium SM2_2_1]